VAAIVPHAGWTFSGSLAALAFAAFKEQRPDIGTFVLLGAAHNYFGAIPAIDEHEAWETPLGPAYVDGELREALRDRSAATVDGAAHHREHSIEVQVPFLKHLFPEARILPIVVPPTGAAIQLGEALAECLRPSHSRTVCLASTDLTHYGPRYGFTPMGVGTEGLRWAAEVNDRQFIELAVRLESRRLLAHARESGSACGPGAVAAVATVAGRLGVDHGIVLAQTTSNEILQRQMSRTSRDSVGYAAIVY
jgi:hypothetical protein